MEANKNIYLDAAYNYTLNNTGSQTITALELYDLCDNQGHCDTGAYHESVQPHKSQSIEGKCFLPVEYKTSDIGKQIVVTARVQLSGGFTGTGFGTCSFSVVRGPRDLEV